jgi:hypothetical protein
LAISIQFLFSYIKDHLEIYKIGPIYLKIQY